MSKLATLPSPLFKGGDKELVEKLGNNDLCPCGLRPALSSAAAATAAAFVGAGRDYYFRER
jgi:hypothetical protein